MLCAISQRIPHDPVVSKVNGYLFERRLIEKYIDEHGTCPITGVPLRKEDLLPVQSSPAIISSGHQVCALGVAAVPQLLAQLQAEWEATALERFALRQRISELELDLAHSVQRCEAAYRVIATLRTTQNTNTNESTEKEEEEMPAEVMQAIAAQEEEQRQQRRARRQYKRPDRDTDTNNHTTTTSQLLISADAAAHVVAVLERPESHARCVGRGGSHLVGVGSADGDYALTVYDIATSGQQVCSVRQGHTGLVHTCTALTNNNTTTGENSSSSDDSVAWLTGSADGTVRLWRPSNTETKSGELRCEQILRPDDGVSALSKATIASRFVLSGGTRGFVTVSDLERGITLATHNNTTMKVNVPLTVVEGHPYGTMALVADAAGALDVWDVRLLRPDTTLRQKNTNTNNRDVAVVRGVVFSPDCVTLATSLSSGQVCVYDLRHTAQPLLTFYSDKNKNNSVPPALAFAPTETFHSSSPTLVVGGVGRLALYDTQCAAEAACLWSAEDLNGGATQGICLVGEAQDRIAACRVDGRVYLYDIK